MTATDHREHSTLTLYEHPFARSCQKVLIALDEVGVAYDVLEEQRDFDRAELAELWPPASFYALAIDPWDKGTHPQLTRYYRALAQRPSFAKVIADARPYRHLFRLPWPADVDRYN